MGDAVDLIPFVSGVGEVTRAVSTSLEIADTVHDTKKAAENIGEVAEAAKKVTKKIHGNSLDCPAINYGYVLLKDGTNEILKYGESIKGTKRYTNKFYTENNCYMLILEQGTKREMHEWQHNKIVEYYNIFKHRPEMNNSFYQLIP